MDIVESKKRSIILYRNMREYEKRTGKNLPFIIADEDDADKRMVLISELLKALGTDAWSAAHFLLEQMVLMNRIADQLYIESPEWEMMLEADDIVDVIVDKFAALAKDYMITAGYLLDTAYEIFG